MKYIVGSLINIYLLSFNALCFVSWCRNITHRTITSNSFAELTFNLMKYFLHCLRHFFSKLINVQVSSLVLQWAQSICSENKNMKYYKSLVNRYKNTASGKIWDSNTNNNPLKGSKLTFKDIWNIVFRAKKIPTHMEWNRMKCIKVGNPRGHAL